MVTEQPPAREKEIIYVPAVPAMMATDEEGGVDLRQAWQVIWEAKWFIGGVTLAATLVAVFVTLFVLPTTYKSEAVLLPATSESSGTGNLADLADSLPLPINLPGGKKINLIMSFLESRSLKERLIDKYDLLPRLQANPGDTEKKELPAGDPRVRANMVQALQNGLLDTVYHVEQNKKSSLITISWVAEEPAFAAKMLERVIAELNYHLGHEYESDAQRDRQFVEGQLGKVAKELEHWEKQVPSQELTTATIQRERLATQTVYTELRKQLVFAKIAEDRELVRFKVLDQPFVPELRFKPARGRICKITLLVSCFLAILVVFIRHAIVRDDKVNRNA